TLADVDRGVRPDAVFRPVFEPLPDLHAATAIVVRDDGCDALHEIRQVRASLRVGAREIALRVRVWVDEARRDDQSARVDGLRGGDPRRAAHEYDAVAANADVGGTPRGASAINDGAVANQDVDLLLRGQSGTREEGD